MRTKVEKTGFKGCCCGFQLSSVAPIGRQNIDTCSSSGWFGRLLTGNLLIRAGEVVSGVIEMQTYKTAREDSLTWVENQVLELAR